MDYVRRKARRGTSMNDEHDDKLALPFPLSDVSNGEWSPRPPTDKQQAVAKLLAEESERRAKR